MKKEGNFLLFIVLLTLISCGHVFYGEGGAKFRIANMTHDNYIIDTDTLQAHRFNVKHYFSKTTDSPLNRIQYIFPSDVKTILDSTKKLFVRFYYPDCKNAKYDMEIAQYAERKNIPFILISSKSSPKRISMLFRKYHLNRKTIYIIPSGKKFGNNILKKKEQFIKNICLSCFHKYHDDLFFVSSVILNKKGKTRLDIQDSAYRMPKIKYWIAKYFN